MSPDTRYLVANCAGSFLLMLAFLTLVCLSAALFLFWRGLRIARRELPNQTARVDTALAQVRSTTADVARRAIEPQVAIASGWAGVMAGVRALRGGASTRSASTRGNDTDAGD